MKYISPCMEIYVMDEAEDIITASGTPGLTVDEGVPDTGSFDDL